MNPLYYLTILPPRFPGCDAVIQDVDLLRRHFGGRPLYINPNHRAPVHVPRLFFGIGQLRAIRALEATHHIHHMLNPDPYPFPFVCTLKKPVIYSLTSGVRSPPGLRPFWALIRRYLGSLAAVTVSDDRSLERLRTCGMDNVYRVQPGVDSARFTHTPIPLHSEIRLMVGSSPWTIGQFAQKGIDVLLATARRQPRLRLVFLWRGVLVDEIKRRIVEMGVEAQVKVLNHRVDVNQILAQIHGSVSLATDPQVIVPYPHSLLESLAAGKPVLVSQSIPMSDDVARLDCGIVIDTVDVRALLAAVEKFARRYVALREAARYVGARDFGIEAMISSYRSVYERVLASRE